MFKVQRSMFQVTGYGQGRGEEANLISTLLLSVASVSTRTCAESYFILRLFNDL